MSDSLGVQIVQTPLGDLHIKITQADVDFAAQLDADGVLGVTPGQIAELRAFGNLELIYGDPTKPPPRGILACDSESETTKADRRREAQ